MIFCIGFQCTRYGHCDYPGPCRCICFRPQNTVRNTNTVDKLGNISTETKAATHFNCNISWSSIAYGAEEGLFLGIINLGGYIQMFGGGGINIREAYIYIKKH